MFQLTISVDEQNSNWIYSIDEIIKSRLNNCNAVSAVSRIGKRVYCVFGCEKETKRIMIGLIKECIIETFEVFAKYDFIKSNLSISLSQLRYEILLRTLVAFDRENERKLLNRIVKIKEGMTLDGYFNFLLTELKERWLEICKLTQSNKDYLFDDDTYNELVRFLISAINPKIKKVTVFESNNKYCISGYTDGGELFLSASDGIQLMYYLIDLAPLELVIDGKLSNGDLFRRIVGIFDAKTIDGRKNYTK